MTGPLYGIRVTFTADGKVENSVDIAADPFLKTCLKALVQQRCTEVYGESPTKEQLQATAEVMKNTGTTYFELVQLRPMTEEER